MPSASQERFTVGVQDIDYSPHYDARFDKKKGYIFDLLALFEKRNNVKFVYISLPNKRLKQRFFERRDLDLIYPLNPSWLNPDIDQRGLMFSSPITKIIGGTMVMPKNKKLTMDKFSTLAVPRGFTPIEWYKLQGKYDFNIVEVANAWDALNMVMLGRADGADIEFNVANVLLAKKQQANQLVLGEYLPISQIHFFMASYRHHFLIKKFDKFTLEQKDAITQLKQEYGLIEQFDPEKN